MSVASVCKLCGNGIIRAGSRPGIFCSVKCKYDWGRLQKPVTKPWLQRKYVEERLSAYAIGRIVDRDPKRVYQWLRDYGIPTRPQRSSRRPRALWDHKFLHQEYVRNGKTQEQIADEQGCSATLVRYWLTKHGIDERHTPMEGRTGARSGNWRGGITPERQAFYAMAQWVQRGKMVWQRDKATCQRCGTRKQRYFQFHIHHIVSFQVAELRLELSNLVLLCRDCHIFVHSGANLQKAFLAPYQAELPMTYGKE